MRSPAPRRSVLKRILPLTVALAALAGARPAVAHAVAPAAPASSPTPACWSTGPN